MSKNQKNTQTQAPAKVVVTKTKGVRSDRLERRRQIDPKTGQVITENHHTYVSGRMDRGNQLSSPFEVTSISNRTGKPISTWHQSAYKAHKAALGRAGHHTNIHIVNHTPSVVDLEKAA